MLIVTGSVTARPDSFEALLEASQAHVARSRLEEGCILHCVQVDSENPLRLFFYEEWMSRTALKLHFAQPGSAAFLAAARSLAAAAQPIAIHEAQPLTRAEIVAA